MVPTVSTDGEPRPGGRSEVPLEEIEIVGALLPSLSPSLSPLLATQCVTLTPSPPRPTLRPETQSGPRG